MPKLILKTLDVEDYDKETPKCYVGGRWRVRIAKERVLIANATEEQIALVEAVMASWRTLWRETEKMKSIAKQRLREDLLDGTAPLGHAWTYEPQGAIHLALLPKP